MNEMETASVNMAITEKKGQTHRPGGCVGIFFRLFDWNRRFAKRKLFSKKLLPLPSARTKQQASEKFGGDEKMPKTKSHLIEDENSGGFPNLRKNGSGGGGIKEQKLKMDPPSLVARLMGLEALPAVPDKHKKGANPVACDVKEEKFDDGGNVFVREDVNFEKRNVKVESRPQKLRKTGQADRRAITRFEAEGLQIKSVLSRSRKHHHNPKLLSPVKSPRISNSSRNSSRASRLIDVAARMLEPGLQSTSRAKCALTYSKSTNYSSKYEVLTGKMEIMSADTMKQQHHHTKYNVDTHKLSLGQTSCTNCGNLLRAVDYRLSEGEQPFACTPSTPNSVHSSQESEYLKPRAPVFYPEHEGDVSSQRDLDKLFFAAEKLDSDSASVDTVAENKPPTQENQEHLPPRNQQCKLQRDESPSSSFKHRTQTQNKFSVGRDRTPPRGKSTNLQSRRAPSPSAANAISRNKDFVALNRSLSGRAWQRTSPNVYKSTIDTERRFCSTLDDSTSQLRNSACKKRTVGLNTPVAKSMFVSSMPVKQRNSKNVDMGGRELCFVDRPIDRPCIKERSTSPRRGCAATSNKDHGVVSFTFNSPLRNENLMCSTHNVKQIDKKHPYQKKLLLDENEGKNALHKQFPLREGALGTLLEQKLKELTTEEADAGNLSKTSTAMILEELLLALTSEQPISPSGHTFHAHRPFQADGKIGGNDIDHLSPGSVLEASFSNDSCFSSSLHDNLECRVVPDNIMDYSCDHPPGLEIEVDIWDSASSVNGGRFCSMIITDLLNYISRILQSINLAGGALMGSKLAHAKDVILIAELLYGNTSAGISDGTKNLLIGAFLLDDLENLAGAIWPNLSLLLGFEETKESNQLRRFLFDCVIEFLDSKCSRYSNAGFKAWRRMPKSMNSKMLIHEVGEEVRRWMSLDGMIPDEIIEWEMSHCLGKWTDFEIETFESGAAIGCDILQRLIEEVVMDLRECKLTF